MILLALCLGLAGTFAYAGSRDLEDDLSSPSGEIISKFLSATTTHPSDLRRSAMEVDIDASVPNLNQHGTLRTLRKISDVGKITYRVLGFQGDNSIKSQVIARYLQAEQQEQNERGMEVSPANYKFKFKGKKVDLAGNNRYVFQLSPRKKRMGLFRGELWLDANTCLPVVEKGRLVKNPSIFFRKVEFERDFAIQNGAAVPAHMASTIDTRLVGRVNLSVNYSAAHPDNEDGIADSVMQAANSLP